MSEAATSWKSLDIEKKEAYKQKVTIVKLLVITTSLYATYNKKRKTIIYQKYIFRGDTKIKK